MSEPVLSFPLPAEADVVADVLRALAIRYVRAELMVELGADGTLTVCRYNALERGHAPLRVPLAPASSSTPPESAPASASEGAGNPAREYSCPACGKVLRSASTLSHHRLHACLGGKLLACPMDDCTQEFPDRRTLRGHLRFGHRAPKATTPPTPAPTPAQPAEPATGTPEPSEGHTAPAEPDLTADVAYWCDRYNALEGGQAPPEPDPVQEAEPEPAAEVTYWCEHCLRPFTSPSACSVHEQHCGRGATHEPAPLAHQELVIGCLEVLPSGDCGFEIEAWIAGAEAALAKHVRRHGRAPSAAELAHRPPRLPAPAA